jgi:hypothetical protein
VSEDGVFRIVAVAPSGLNQSSQIVVSALDLLFNGVPAMAFEFLFQQLQIVRAYIGVDMNPPMRTLLRAHVSRVGRSDTDAQHYGSGQERKKNVPDGFHGCYLALLGIVEFCRAASFPAPPI